MRKLIFLLVALLCASSVKAFYYNNLYFYPTSDGCEVRGFAPDYVLPTAVNLHIPSYAYDEDGNRYKVTAIADKAFMGHVEIVQLFIPSTVETIGSQAFSSCVSLVALTLYPSTRTIGESAFFGCLSLTSLNTSAEVVGAEAFRGCIALSAVNLGAPMKYIEPGAFMGCSILTNIDIPHSVERIGDAPGYTNRNGVFEDCLSLKSVTFAYNLSKEKPSIKTLGSNTFKNCVDLTSLDFPYSLTTVYENAFLRCTSLKHLDWGGPNTLRVYPVDLSGVKLQEMVCHGNVNWDNTKNLQPLTELETVQYDTYATEVQSRLFANIPSLKNVYLYNATTIKSYAFNNCTGLQNLMLSSDLEQIEAGAFTGCTSLADIKFGSKVTAIADCLGNSGIRTLTIPDNVTSLALPSNCSMLTTVTIGNGVQYCANGSFAGCTSLNTVHYGSRVTAVNLSPASVRLITCANPTPPAARNFHSEVYQNCTLVVPVGAAEAYRKAQYWKNFSRIIESDDAAVDDISIDDVAIDISECNISVQSGNPVSVYTTEGKLVLRLPAGRHTVSVAHGIYVLVTGKTVRKILI